MMSTIRWSHADMIDATIGWWGDDSIEGGDCEVRRTHDGETPCLVVLHRPTGRTSDEAGDAGRWNLDGTARHTGP